jgi:hypothetical protein
MKAFIILLFVVGTFESYSQNEETYYFYCVYTEQGSFENYPEGYKPKAWFTTVESTACDRSLSLYSNGLENKFIKYMKAYYTDLPYGKWRSKAYKSREETEEKRLEDMASTNKYSTYKITEIRNFSYLCD